MRQISSNNGFVRQCVGEKASQRWAAQALNSSFFGVSDFIIIYLR